MIKNFFLPLFDAEKRVREYGREDRWQQVSVIIWLTIAAFALLFGLMLFATYNDIIRLVTGVM